MSQTLSVRVEQTGPSTATAQARVHTVLVDRPVAKGGEDRGPLGGEYLLVALGGCFLSNLLAVIRAREAEVSRVTVSLTGIIDGAPDRFTSFTMSVTAVHRDSELVRKFIAMAARACAVTNTLRRSADVTIEFEGVVIASE
ncbi:MAG: OsmC family protein [Acidobacteriota bacterium]